MNTKKQIRYFLFFLRKNNCLNEFLNSFDIDYIKIMYEGYKYSFLRDPENVSSYLKNAPMFELINYAFNWHRSNMPADFWASLDKKWRQSLNKSFVLV